ncbi:MAG: hypothetical protein KJT03_01160 [Verrucomicrobiae bacterium]|nr:hypothetical protein [Verrucomicrobiae bacterium]
MIASLESLQNLVSNYGTYHNITTLGMIIVVILLIVSVYRMLKSFHPTMVVFVLGILTCGLFLYWVHNRNEPAFMTPAVEVVAGFLPKKGELREYETPK